MFSGHVELFVKFNESESDVFDDPQEFNLFEAFVRFFV